MNKNIICYILLATLNLATSFLADQTFEGTEVNEYNQTNFPKKTGIGLGINNIKGDYFIMFYKKQTPQNENFRKIWLDLKKQHKDDNISAIHCPDNIDLCQSFNISEYPTLLLITKKEYKYCEFKGEIEEKKVNDFWENRCKGLKDGELKEINFRISSGDEIKDSEGNVQTQELDVEQPTLDELEKLKQSKRFKKNQGFQNRIMYYLKKLGPLTIVILSSTCLLSIIFICNKLCQKGHKDTSTKRISKSSGRKSKAGYKIARNTDTSCV